MSHEPLLSAVKDVIHTMQAAVDALRVVEHHLLSGQGQGGAAEHVLHALAGAKGLAAAPLSSLAVAALPAEDGEEPAPAQAEASASPPVASPPVASPPVASPPVASPPVASPPVASPPVAGGRGKPQGRRARAGAPSRREVPPDAVASHCRACQQEVLVVARDAQLLDQDGSDHAQSCPMSRVLSGQEERPARARRKAPGAYSPASPPNPQSPSSPPAP